MSRLNLTPTDDAAFGRRRDSQTGGISLVAGTAVPADRQRWAQLIADGAIPFPAGLGADDEARLAQDVSQRRRLRLVNFIARQIAIHIKRNIDVTDALEHLDDQKPVRPQ